MSNQDKQPVGPLSRRIFLRGAGVVMTLPWLESLPVWGATGEEPKAPSATPKRFVVQFMGTGISPDHWWAKGEGATMELSKSLQPLEPFKKRTRYRRKRSSIDNGAALEETFGQYLAAIRRNIDNVDPQGKETSHAGQFHRAPQFQFDGRSRTFR